MRLVPTVNSNNGVVSVRLTAQFLGDSTDAHDQALITAYGDPSFNLAGAFTDPNDSTFVFSFSATEAYFGLTSEMGTATVRFAKSDSLLGTVLALDCVTSDPTRAATIWTAAMQARIATYMTTFRQKSDPLTSLPATTV